MKDIFLSKRHKIIIFAIMSTLTIHPADMNQETAIRLFLDALHVDYNATEMSADETTYLSSSATMKAHLDKAAEQERNGEGVKISLDDIWK
jgi:hypothetical protein